jgi:DNA-directed RNA polymerase subunit beta
MKEMKGASQRVRRNFGKIGKTLEIPNLIQVQKHSYERFLQKNDAPEDRQDYGLQSRFQVCFLFRTLAGLRLWNL